ncbi:uncharacterized protein P884DRAFT_112195 [Thermothelomyces heterothallicus CBS 202.75]|uniref:uncharacterized protein n=1 Tax=Thermothelomyces heterothallicus CBS 202.75 TaxID=1149848 RepID=UPI00374335EE
MTCNAARRYGSPHKTTLLTLVMLLPTGRSIVRGSGGANNHNLRGQKKKKKRTNLEQADRRQIREIIDFNGHDSGYSPALL